MMTPLTEGPLWGDPHRSRWLLERIPARRPGTPDDLAGATLLLASPSSAYITGHTLVIDGGYLVGGSWTPDEH
jgi:NAD(P)-dependent dehydrogenase (short-subunit alcohol dehydrogenase family)